MEDILKSNLPLNEKNFWYSVGAKIQSRVKGIVQVFYDNIENTIIIRTFFEKFNYTISNSFPCWLLIEETNVINQILDSIRFSVYKEIFK